MFFGSRCLLDIPPVDFNRLERGNLFLLLLKLAFFFCGREIAGFMGDCFLHCHGFLPHTVGCM